MEISFLFIMKESNGTMVAIIYVFVRTDFSDIMNVFYRKFLR